MIRHLAPNKSFYVASLVSLACHLVFAMTAGAYFLTREPAPQRQEVRVKIVEKQRPDKPQMREKRAQPKLDVVPVVEPLQTPQPAAPQQPVQVAAVVPVTDVQPVVLEQVTAPSNAAPAKMVHSRALTARGSTARPVRSVAVNSTPMASTHTVQPRTASVRAVQIPQIVTVAPVPTAGPRGTAATAMVSSRSSARRTPSARAVAPVSVPREAPVQAALPPQAAPGPSTDPGALDGYKNGLHRRLTYVAQKRYQRSTARRANQEGKVMVAFTVMRNGEVKDVYVKNPSRHAMLNQTALEAIKQAAPFTEFPDDIVEEELNLAIPFSFTLR